MNKFSAARAFLSLPGPGTGQMCLLSKDSVTQERVPSLLRREEFDLETVAEKEDNRKRPRNDIYLRFDLSSSSYFSGFVFTGESLTCF